MPINPVLSYVMEIYKAPFNCQTDDVWILLYWFNKRIFSLVFCLNVGGRF